MTVTFHHREFLNSKRATASTGPSRRNLATMRSLAMSASLIGRLGQALSDYAWRQHPAADRRDTGGGRYGDRETRSDQHRETANARANLAFASVPNCHRRCCEPIHARWTAFGETGRIWAIYDGVDAPRRQPRHALLRHFERRAHVRPWKTGLAGWGHETRTRESARIEISLSCRENFARFGQKRVQRRFPM